MSASRSPWTPTTEFRVGTVLRRAWRIFTQHWLAFALLVLVGQIPQLVLTTLSITSSVPNTPGFWVGIMVGIIIVLLLSPIQNAVINLIAFNAMADRPTDVATAFRRAVGWYLPMVGTFVLISLAVSLGMILLVIPGMIVALMFCVASQACIVERIGPITALGRSRSLTKGYRWPILGLLLICILLFIPFVAIQAVVALMLPSTLAPLMSPLINALPTAFFAAIFPAVYHDLRVTKEGISSDRLVAVFD